MDTDSKGESTVDYLSQKAESENRSLNDIMADITDEYMKWHEGDKGWMMKMEVGSILRKKWSNKLIGYEEINELWTKFLTLPIIYIQESHIYELAWEIADANKQVHLYDAIYIAISDGIPFWTADERLVNSVSKSNAILKLL